MALGSTQPLTEMCTRNFPGGKGQPARKADNLTAMCEPIVKTMREPRCLTTLWAFIPVTGIYLPFYFVIHNTVFFFPVMFILMCLKLLTYFSDYSVALFYFWLHSSFQTF
jgi:hypothetical protein